MSEWLKIVLTASATIIGSVVTLAVSQVFQRRFIDPIMEQRKVVADIDVALTYWADVIANPVEVKDEKDRSPQCDKAIDELRGLAARLIAATNAIWFTRLIPRLRVIALVPIWPDDVRNAAGRLIRLSTSVYFARAF